MKDIKSIKETIKTLLEERKNIFNMLMSRRSTAFLKSNSWKLAEATGFSIIEVNCLYNTTESC